MGKQNGTKSAWKSSFQYVFLNVYVYVILLAEEMTEHADKKHVRQKKMM